MSDELTIRQIVQVSSWLLGTVLHLLLLRMILRRKRWVRGEGLFALLVTAVGLWNLGRFTYVFVHLLLKAREPPWVPVACDIVAFLGVMLIPSSLLHTLGFLLVERLAPSPSKTPPSPAVARLIRAARVCVALVYLPVALAPELVRRVVAQPAKPGVEQLQGLIAPFATWFVLALLVSAALSVALARLSPELRESRFYVSLVPILAGTATLLVAIYAFGAESIGETNPLTEGLIVLVSTIPSLMFGYYVHRHHYMEFIVRRSLFYLVLVTGIVVAYIFGISKVSRALDENMGLHHRLVEAVLILALVFLFPPFRRALQHVFNRIFFKETDVYRRVFSELTNQLGRGPATVLSTLVRQVARTVGRTLAVEEAAIILLDEAGRPTLSTHRRVRPDVSATVDFLTGPGAPAYFSAEDLGNEPQDVACAGELDALHADAAFAVRAADARLLGLFLVGPKTSGQPLFAEEIELCRALAGELAVSIENMRLYEEKLALERKIHEAERQLSLGRFSASVAHRVKNPLSSIKAITQVMAEDLPPGDARRQDLDIVVSEVDRLTAVINQLLDFAEPTRPDPETGLDLREMLSEVALLYQHEAGLTGVEIRTEIPASVPLVRGERVALREVFANLIQNGIHAMPQGGPLAVHVRAPAPPRPDEAPEKSEDVLVVVVDGGVGVSPENLERIFQPFFTTKPRGTGLGLAIARHKLEEAGGRIAVESPVPDPEREPGAKGPGALFRVWLPVASRPAERERDKAPVEVAARE